jgi:low affinity Fe/Cu permease
MIGSFIGIILFSPIRRFQGRERGSKAQALDERIRAVKDARNEFIGIERLTDRQVEAIRNCALGGRGRASQRAQAGGQRRAAVRGAAGITPP